MPASIIGMCKDFLHPSVDSKFSFLEVGPGTGRFLREVLSAFPHTTQYGILDADSAWAQYCEELVRLESDSCVPKISVNADADFSVFLGDRFDLIHAHAVLVQLRARLGLRIVSETAKLLKPGGLLVFDAFSSEDITSLHKMSEASWATFYHPDWLKSELESSGLEVVSRVTAPYGLNGSSEYWIAKMKGF